MRYRLQDLFSDVIHTAKETGVWQTLNPDEKKTLMEYFLCNFDAFMKEVQWHKISCCTTCYVTDGNMRGRTGGGRRK